MKARDSRANRQDADTGSEASLKKLTRYRLMVTGMMAEVLRKFGFEEARKQQRPLLARDYVFTPGFPQAQPFKTVYERVFLEETPLAVVREIHLQHAENLHASAKLTLALCEEGFAGAMTLLERFTRSFQRAIPNEFVQKISPSVGDFGVAWAWERPKGAEVIPDVIAFVRYNVFVGLTGHDTPPLFMPAVPNQIDGELRNLPTTESYADQQEGLLASLRGRAEGAPKLPVGGRLDLGEFAPSESASFFFLTSSGSVNRDPRAPQKWYYRAGGEKGAQEITLYRVGRGILPVRERLKVEVV